MFNFIRKLGVWFGRQKPIPVVPVIHITERDICRLTMQQWKSDENMVKLAGKVLSDQMCQKMLDLLRMRHFTQITIRGGTIEDKALHLSKMEGYVAALNDFESLGELEKPPVEIEATFEEPE